MINNQSKMKVPQRSAAAIRGPAAPPPALPAGPPPPQLPEEKDEQYEQFLLYWRHGTTISLRQVAKLARAPISVLVRWRKLHRWDARIAALHAETPEITKGWADRREDLREQEWMLHLECLAAGRKALLDWQASGKVATLGDVVRFLEFAARMGRLAAGVPDATVAVTGEDGEPIQVQFEAALKRAYGPVVDVLSEVVNDVAEESGNDDNSAKGEELSIEAETVGGGAGGGDPVRGAASAGLRPHEPFRGRGSQADSGPGVETGSQAPP